MTLSAVCNMTEPVFATTVQMLENIFDCVEGRAALLSDSSLIKMYNEPSCCNPDGIAKSLRVIM